MPQTTYNGTFNLILGSMWSGKTSELVRRYTRHTIGGRKCLMIKYKNDTRYDEEMVVTHDKVKVQGLVCEYLYEADKVSENYDVVCIDEVQFYKDAHIFCDKWANEGKIIEACGLNGTFNRTEFPIISKLLPLAENITFLKAVCKETGHDATYSNINIDVEGNTTEVIGGSDKYNAVDRLTFFNSQTKKENDYKIKLKEFVKVYMEMKNNKFALNEYALMQLDNYINQNIQNTEELTFYKFADMCVNYLKFMHAVKEE
ncbi:thymidine kinase [Fadolivirus algeromassiliense]|jgi:thymidine kinase|uniref:Thymidine kinase n=1 Tax=Fadolivirus FV1/VV64 TaxID=3070911 RepID=A0A7D3UQ35_9VIRU|nr:thymidine kinase [Fadolivirus algeromassiliense]QKF94268.1 thymidine kinase [Fadolivirus FV1/VV64]